MKKIQKTILGLILMFNVTSLQAENCNILDSRAKTLESKSSSAFSVYKCQILMSKANNLHIKANTCRLKKIMKKLGLKDR